MSNKTRRLMSSVAFALGLALVLPGCDGGGVTGPPELVPTPPPPPPPVKTLIAEGSVSTLGVNFIADIPFATSAAGSLEVRVQWQSAADHIVVYVAKGSCSFQQLRTDRCNLVAISESTTPKPRVLTVPGATAGSYVLWIGNLGPKVESPSYRIFLTTGGSANSIHDESAGTAAQALGGFDYAPSGQ